MIVNPYTAEGQVLLAPILGTHIVEDSLGIVGTVLKEPTNLQRAWTIRALYTPIQGRALGGFRTKLEDQKGFVTFCNQRDLEVLLGDASPGDYCAWLDDEYVEPGGPGWFGLCVDELDLLDDLYDRELEARALLPRADMVLTPGLCFERRVHNGGRDDYIETMMLRFDMDQEMGFGPDPRIETIAQRWVSVDRTAPSERARLWLKL